MSPPTWTPDALSSEARSYARSLWRVVEAQHRASTMRITDTLEEQAILEDLIEEVKPPMPPECRRPALPPVHAVPLRALSPRLALPPGAPARRRVLRLRAGRDRDRRDRLLPPAVPPRGAGGAAARPADRAHRVSGRAPRPTRLIDLTAAALRARRRGLAPSGRLRPCQDLADARARRRAAGDPLRLGARPGAPRERRAALARGVRGQRAGRHPDLARVSAPGRGAGVARFPRPPCGSSSAAPTSPATRGWASDPRMAA